MARATPTPEDIPLPGVQGQRPVASYDVSPWGAGAQAMAKGVETLGAGIQTAAKDIAEVQTYRARNDALLAQKTILGGAIQLRQDYKPGGPKYVADPEVMANNYHADLDNVVNQGLQKVPEGPFRTHVEAMIQGPIAHEKASVDQEKFNTYRQNAHADIYNQHKYLVQTVGPDEDPTHTAMVRSLNSSIDDYASKQYITPLEAAQQKHDLAQDLAVGRAIIRGEQGDAAKVERELRASIPRGGDGVSPRGGQSIYPPMPADPNRRDVAGSVVSAWRTQGMSNNGIAGVLHNIGEESSFNPAQVTRNDQPHWTGEAAHAHGLYQEGGAEWMRYLGWLRETHQGADWRDHNLQSEFAAWNLKKNYPNVWLRMNVAKTPEEAAAAYLTGYLKPSYANQQTRLARLGGGIAPIESYTGGQPAGTAAAPGAVSPSEAFPNGYTVQKLPDGRSIRVPVQQPAGAPSTTGAGAPDETPQSPDYNPHYPGRRILVWNDKDHLVEPKSGRVVFDERGPPNEATSPDYNPLFAKLDPQRRDSLITHMQSLQHKFNTEALTQLKAGIKDDIDAAAQEGYVGKGHSRDDFVRVHGEEKGEAEFREYNEQMQLAMDMHNMRGMSPDERQAIIAAHRPDPSQPGYAARLAPYERLAEYGRKLDELQEKAALQEKKGAIADLKTRSEDVFQEALHTGGVSKGIGRGEFIAALGQEDGAAAWNAYTDATQYAADRHRFETATPEERQGYLSTYRPQEGQANQKLGWERYDALSQLNQHMSALEEKAAEQEKKNAVRDLGERAKGVAIEAERTGKVSQGIGRDEFIRTMGAEDGAAAWNAYTDATQYGVDKFNLRGKSLEEQQAVLGAYQPTPGQGELAWQRHDELTKAADHLHTQLMNDPGGYTLSTMPAVQEAWNKLSEASSPQDRRAAAQDFAAKATAEQLRLGVPPQNVSIVPKSYVNNLIAQVEKPAPADKTGGPDQVNATIRQQADMWGSAWPQIYRQMKGASPLVVVLGAGVKPAAAQLLADNATVKFGDIVKDEQSAKAKDITDSVDTELAPFASSTVGMAGGIKLYNDVRSQIEKLSAIYAFQNGMRADEAAKKATEEVINFKYDYRDGFRIPAKEHTNPAGVPSDQIQLGAAVAKQNLGGNVGDLDLKVKPAIDTFGAAYTPAQLQAETADARRNGRWTTNNDESGLWLTYGGRVVMKPDGTPLSLTWKQLGDLAEKRPPRFEPMFMQ